MYEKIFTNANIYGSTESSLLVRGEKIATVGRASECRAMAQTDPDAIDCCGKFLTPGFTDSHCHLVEAGEALIRPVLAGLSVDDLLTVLGSERNDESSGLPMVAMGLDDRQFRGLQDASRIRLTAENGVLLFHQSGHSALADRTASQLLEIPETGGEVTLVQDPYEHPRVLSMLQKRKHQDVYLALCLEAALANYHRFGVTSLHDNTWDPEVFRLMSMMTHGIDIQSWVKGDDPLSAWRMGDGVLPPAGISFGPVKFFIDGAFFNQMAWLLEPYNGSDNYGDGVPSDKIASRITPFIAQRRQCVFHAAGDRAISELCDALESLLPVFPWIPDLRIRIEHAQLIDEGDFERIRKLGIAVSVQPDACTDPERDIQLLGEARALRAYPHKRVLDESIPLAFGSDFPYESTTDPFSGIASVCNRAMGESLTPMQAVDTYTRGGAYAGFFEEEKGRIADGLQADFFLSEVDPLADPSGARDSLRSVFHRGLCVYTAHSD